MMHRKAPRLLVAVYFSSASLLARPAMADVLFQHAARSAGEVAFALPVEHGGWLRTRIPQLSSFCCPASVARSPPPLASMTVGFGFGTLPSAAGSVRFGAGRGSQSSSTVALSSSPSDRRPYSGGPPSSRGGRGGDRGGGRGAARGGARGGGWREDLPPSERRVLQKQRRDGVISGDDLAKLTRAEHADRFEASSERGRGDRGSPRGAPRGESRGAGRDNERIERRGEGRSEGRNVGRSEGRSVGRSEGRSEGRARPKESKPIPEWVMKKMFVDAEGAPKPMQDDGLRPQRDRGVYEQSARGSAREGGGDMSEMSPRRAKRLEWNARRLENDASGAWREGESMQQQPRGVSGAWREEGGMQQPPRYESVWQGARDSDNRPRDQDYGWDGDTRAPPPPRQAACVMCV